MAEGIDARVVVPGVHAGYYGGDYWDDFAIVAAWMNERIAGDPNTGRFEHFAKWADRMFERALILNCGNGWVERELHEVGVVGSAVGVDCDDALLDEARRGAPAGFEYQRCDVNRDVLPSGPFDLVVNYAAAHHVAYLDRVIRGMRERITPDGWLLSYDYTGPHRNQFSAEQWFAADAVNAQLPAEFRQDMFAYPHLPTMLLQDPTEAVHSELVQTTLARYFRFEQEVALGGAVAYLILTHNSALHAGDPSARDDVVRFVLAADEQYLHAHPDSSLFTFSIGRPRELPAAEVLARWTDEENAREDAAAAAGGEYYERSLLQRLYLELEDRRVATIRAQEERMRVEEATKDELAHAEARHAEEINALRHYLDELHASTSWRITAPLRRLGDVVRKRRRIREG